jgi:hypothetical protein
MNRRSEPRGQGPLSWQVPRNRRRTFRRPRMPGGETVSGSGSSSGESGSVWAVGASVSLSVAGRVAAGSVWLIRRARTPPPAGAGKEWTLNAWRRHGCLRVEGHEATRARAREARRLEPHPPCAGSAACSPNCQFAAPSDHARCKVMGPGRRAKRPIRRMLRIDRGVIRIYVSDGVIVDGSSASVRARGACVGVELRFESGTVGLALDVSGLICSAIYRCLRDEDGTNPLARRKIYANSSCLGNEPEMPAQSAT